MIVFFLYFGGDFHFRHSLGSMSLKNFVNGERSLEIIYTLDRR